MPAAIDPRLVPLSLAHRQALQIYTAAMSHAHDGQPTTTSWDVMQARNHAATRWLAIMLAEVLPAIADDHKRRLLASLNLSDAEDFQ